MDSKEIIAGPYRRGADAGLPFGLYLSAMYVASVYSASLPLLGLLVTLMFFLVPVIVYKSLRRSFLADNGTTMGSSLWMQGIMMFLCGGLIYSLVVMVYCRWINPTYIADSFTNMATVLAADGGEMSARVAETSRLVVENGAVPSAASWAMAVFWLVVFSGSLLSGLCALLVRARGVPVKRNV